MCDIIYPFEILPQNGYKVNGFDLDDIINDHPDIIISRRIDDNIEDYIDNDEGRPHLNTDCFGEHFEHLSVNLMNSKFRNEHIKYSAKGEAGKPWKGQTISLEEYKVHIESLDNSSAVFYKAKLLHKHSFKTKLSLPKDKYKAMRTFLGQMAMTAFSGQATTQNADFDGYVGIDHVPVNLNYWHCQVEIHPKGMEKTLQNAKSWRKEIFTHVLSNILAYNFSLSSDVCCQIDTKHYLEKES